MFDLQRIPKDLPIHFVGIGGCSMSGLALLLHQRGYRITGSDRNDSVNVREARRAGIPVVIGHRASHVHSDAQIIVTTAAAVGQENPEIQEGRRRGLVVVDRAELLASVMAQHPVSVAIAGTAGKTTTTSLVARVLTAAGLDPTVSIGSSAKNGDNYRDGAGDYAVTEACEYHRAFHYLRPHTAVVLNAVPGDHGDYFTDDEDTKDAFRTFVGNLRSDGLLIVSADDQHARELGVGISQRRLMFGLAETADYRATDMSWDRGRARFQVLYRGEELGVLAPNLMGVHNVTNILAVVAVGHQHGLSLDQMREAIESFTGAPRRLQFQGDRDGVAVYDDLACTPGEIDATMNALRRATDGGIAVVLRPNSYSRVRDLLGAFPACFADEAIVVTDIYPGRDTEDHGMHARDVERVLREAGLDAHYIPDRNGIPDAAAICAYLNGRLSAGDTLITVGPADVAPIGPTWLAFGADHVS